MKAQPAEYIQPTPPESDGYLPSDSLDADQSIETANGYYYHEDIARHIDEAHLLLAYASKTGLELDESLISSIVNAHHYLHHGQWSPEREIHFWRAFNELARLVQPVSVSSLMATSLYKDDGHKHHVPQQSPSLIARMLGMNKFDSYARLTVSAYQTWSLAILILLLLSQIYWLLGSMRVAPVKQLSAEIEMLTTQLEDERSRVDPDKWSESREINVLNTKLDESQRRLNANYEELKLWGWESLWSGFYSSSSEADTVGGAIEGQPDNIVSGSAEQSFQQQTELYPFQNFPGLGSFPEPVEYYSPEKAMEIEILLQEKEFVLRAIQLYLLPLLYGLLGASAYVLRTLTVEIRNLTYIKESNISYRLRIQLGALSGLAISWFITPETFTFSALSPLALAFLGGYSVEVLFAAMDRLIYMFSSSEEPGRSTGPAIRTARPASLAAKQVDVPT